jgi:glycogen(starch) synthase
VIYNGWAAPPLAPAPLPFDPPVLLCLGRLVPEKGFDVALEAMALLVGRFPGLRMVVVGDGPAREPLAVQAAGLGLADAVEFVGWVSPDDVFAAINRATVALMPSRTEAFSNAVVQAQLMGRPVVASRVGGMPEAVLDGCTGRLVEADDAGALAAATGELLADPPATRRMGLAARRRVLEDFDFQRHVVDGYDALYRRLARRSADA